MKSRYMNAWRASALAMLLPLAGCLHPRLDRGAELVEHPEFGAAAQAAPNWVEKALDIIVELEAQIERQ